MATSDASLTALSCHSLMSVTGLAKTKPDVTSVEAPQAPPYGMMAKLHYKRRRFMMGQAGRFQPDVEARRGSGSFMLTAPRQR